MRPTFRIILKILEFLAVVACIIAKAFTDLEARRVFFINQKYSREWSLLDNVTWSNAGNAFTNVTYGGYAIITLLLGINRCIDSQSRPTIIEKIFLGLGCLLFFIVGGLVFAALDQVPHQLVDNSVILGCLSFFVAFLFLIDLADPMGKRRTENTQTNTDSIDRHDRIKRQSIRLDTNDNIDEGDLPDNANRRPLPPMKPNTQRAAQPQPNIMNVSSQPQPAPMMQQSQPTQFLETDFNGPENSVSRPMPDVRNYRVSQYPNQNPPMQMQPQQFIPPETRYNPEQQFHQYHPEDYGMQEREYHQSYQPNPHSTHHQQNQPIPQPDYIREDYVETRVLPTAQSPVFSKVKQTPNILNHFETGPYRKILNRNQLAQMNRASYRAPQQQHQQQPHSAQYSPKQYNVHQERPQSSYQRSPQSQKQYQFHDNLNFVDDFSVKRHETYIPGPKVDQGKLVIRDYSKNRRQSNCDCNHDNERFKGHDDEAEEDNSPIKPGYVASAAKMWDNRTRNSTKSNTSSDLKGLSTVV